MKHQKSSLEVSDVFGSVLKRETISASGEQWKIINSILHCRTESLGGHLYRCTECSTEQPRYNSCRNRHCPKCQGQNTARWLQRRETELLDVPYFHLVFTVPSELNPIILQNKEVMLNILFASISKALKDVAKRKFEGKIGFLSILHTWGQQLQFHPHIHCVLPGAILKENGAVFKTPKDYFVSDKALASVFRAVFIRSLVKAYTQGKLEFFYECEEMLLPEHFFALISDIKEKQWIVHAKRPFAGPGTVLRYLARYTHRIAISNSRLVSLKNNRVTFTYKDYAHNEQQRFCSLSDKEFVRRFLLHTLPKQFVRIRHFGFLANGCRAKIIQRIHAQTGKPETPEQKPLKHSVCSCCGSENLLRVREITPSYSSKSHRHKILPLIA